MSGLSIHYASSGDVERVGNLREIQDASGCWKESTAADCPLPPPGVESTWRILSTGSLKQ